MNEACDPESSDWGAQAAREALQPIRPGVPGERPFWNAHASRFIYAPAFEFEPHEGACSYRFTVGSLSFEAPVPWAPLTPIWADVPVGEACLKVEALAEAGGDRVLKVYPLRAFFRMAPFNGPYTEPAMSYMDSARWQLELIYEECRAWIDADALLACASEGAEKSYSLLVGRYPAKFVSRTIACMCAYARLAPGEERRAEALQIACNAADYLIGASAPAGAGLAHFPPTYRYTNGTSTSEVAGEVEQVMVSYSVFAADAYLDLYEAVQQDQYLEATRRIIQTFERLLLPQGSWHLKMEVASAEPTSPNLYVPMEMLNLLERLVDRHGWTQYADMRQTVLDYIVEHRVEPFDLEGQFEDVLPRPPYSNHTSNLPAHIATYMLNHADECPEYVTTAEELLRFAEDQFVTWERPQVYKDVFVPSVAEQYVCGAVNYSVATHMAASARAYQVTGKPIFLAKAQTLADALTQIQHCSNGWYPTWWRSGQDHAWWINCVADCALLMCQVGEMMWAARPASAAPLSQSENR